MRDANKVGVATVVMRDKEHLVAVRPAEDVLIVETMYFDSEIRDARTELDTLPATDVEFQEREIDIARQLIDMLTTTWDPTRYKNTYRDRVEELIERKRQGKAIVFQAETPKSNVVDLMAALEASVARTGKVTVKAPEPKDERIAAKAVTSARHVHRASVPATKADLLKEAKARGLKADPKATKAELETLLASADEDEPEAPARKAPARARR